MKKVFIDTDVILDFFFDRAPFAEFASKVFNQCAQKNLKGVTSPLVISNVYYLLRKTAGHGKVIDRLKQLLTFIEVIGINQTVVLNALNSKFKDFEDGLQHYCAIEQGDIELILTRNIKDYRHSDLAVMTPETFLKGNGPGP